MSPGANFASWHCKDVPLGRNSGPGMCERQTSKAQAGGYIPKERALGTYVGTEVFDVHLLINEMSEEVSSVPNEGRCEQAQELHDPVRGVLVIEHLQQAGHGAVLLYQLYHTVKLHAATVRTGPSKHLPRPPPTPRNPLSSF